MKTRLFILTILLLSLFVSCRKKEKETIVESTQPVMQTTNAFNACCMAINKYQYTVSNNTISLTGNSATAFFTLNTLTTTATGGFSLVSCGTVVASAFDTLKYYSGTYDYTIGVVQYVSPVTWKGTGGSLFPAFTATCSETFPSIPLTTLNLFPNSISKNTGFTLTLNGITNADRTALKIIDNNGFNVFSAYSGEIIPTSNSVSFTFNSQQLGSLANTNLGTIELYLINDDIQSLNGKNIRFSAITQYNIVGFSITN